MRLRTRIVQAQMRAPFTAAHGTLTVRELLLVEIEAADGRIGYGEAAPLPSYDGVTMLDVDQALVLCRPVIESYSDATPIDDILARCSELTVLPQALAAGDLPL